MNTNQSSRGIDAHWYAVDAHGAATLCTCEEDARETAAESAQMFPNCAPYTAVQLVPVSAPTSHPIPTGATGDRDWELACDNCNGSGHVFVKHQVAERKTDVQEFKEECEACEGRGFTVAFEDIPGIAEYVRKSRTAPSAPGDAQKVYHFEQRSRFGPWIEVEKPTAKSVEFVKRSDDPATRNVRDAVWNGFNLIECMTIARRGFDFWAAKPHNHRWFKKIDGTPIPNDLPVCIADEFKEAIDAALAAQVPQQGEA